MGNDNLKNEEQCVIHVVSNSVCPECGKEKYPKEYTCIECYLKRLKQTDC